MSDDTLPPNTPRTFLKKLWAWGWAHTVISAFLIGSAVGFVAGKL